MRSSTERYRRTEVALFVIASLGTAGCLDPLVDDTVDPRRALGDPALSRENATHVEDDPELLENVKQFPGQVALLKGFVNGRPVRYWNIGGPNPALVAPMYIVIGPDGQPRPPIIDALPGDLGYSPYWRRIHLRTTAAYNGEKIFSREAVDAALKLGLLEAPEVTRTVSNCPVVLRTTRVPVGGGEEPKATEQVWFRNRLVDWIPFPGDVELDPRTREIPTSTVYVIQRINEPTPIYEYATGRDLDGDQVLDASNNIFPMGIGDPGYTPRWHAVLVRTKPEYPSIDTSSAGAARPGITSEGEVMSSPDVISRTKTGVLVNCPVQRELGEL